MWLLECPKAPVLEHPSRVNMLKGIKHWWNHFARTFLLISINLSHTELENIPFSQIQILDNAW